MRVQKLKTNDYECLRDLFKHAVADTDDFDFFIQSLKETDDEVLKLVDIDAVQDRFSSASTALSWLDNDDLEFYLVNYLEIIEMPDAEFYDLSTDDYVFYNEGTDEWFCSSYALFASIREEFAYSFNYDGLYRYWCQTLANIFNLQVFNSEEHY